MNILVVTMARFDVEPSTLQLFGTDWGVGGRIEYWAKGLPELANIVFEAASKADYVCVDESALGVALIDDLSQRGVRNLLTSHRLRPLGV